MSTRRGFIGRLIGALVAPKVVAAAKPVIASNWTPQVQAEAIGYFAHFPGYSYGIDPAKGLDSSCVSIIDVQTGKLVFYQYDNEAKVTPAVWK